MKEEIKYNKFELASLHERDMMTKIFKEWNTTQYQFTPIQGFDRVDGFFTGRSGNEVVFEVKCRNISKLQYDTTCIEKNKLDNLLSEATKTGHIPYLFLFFGDEKIHIEKLSHDVEYKWFWLECPETSVDGNEELVWKQVVDFKTNVINIKRK